MDKEKSIVQTVRLEGRRHLFINGVNNVISFDDISVTLDTVAGELCIQGSELHINDLSLEKGEVSLEGRIDELVYEEPEINKKTGLFGKLLK